MFRITDSISLRTWTGKPYRSKQRVLMEAIVDFVCDVEIEQHGGITLRGGNGTFTERHGYSWKPDPDTFAHLDGFSSWQEMRDWFAAEHGLPFRGIVIGWRKRQ